jgi:hypothetical protein
MHNDEKMLRMYPPTGCEWTVRTEKSGYIFCGKQIDGTIVNNCYCAEHRAMAYYKPEDVNKEIEDIISEVPFSEDCNMLDEMYDIDV